MSLVDTALGLLQRHGESITASYESGGDIDPATGIVTTPPTTNSLDGFGYLGDYANNEIDGTLIRGGDIKLSINALTVRPEQGWVVTADSREFKVVNVKVIKKSGVDVIYICQVRAR